MPLTHVEGPGPAAANARIGRLCLPRSRDVTTSPAAAAPVCAAASPGAFGEHEHTCVLEAGHGANDPELLRRHLCPGGEADVWWSFADAADLRRDIAPRPKMAAASSGRAASPLSVFAFRRVSDGAAVTVAAAGVEFPGSHVVFRDQRGRILLAEPAGQVTELREQAAG